MTEKTLNFQANEGDEEEGEIKQIGKESDFSSKLGRSIVPNICQVQKRPLISGIVKV